MNHTRFNLKSFLTLSVISFLILVLIFSGLPALLLMLHIPSFTIGNDALWILCWKNEVNESGIIFNLVPLLIVAVLIGMFGFFQLLSDRH